MKNDFPSNTVGTATSSNNLRAPFSSAHVTPVGQQIAQAFESASTRETPDDDEDDDGAQMGNLRNAAMIVKNHSH